MGRATTVVGGPVRRTRMVALALCGWMVGGVDLSGGAVQDSATRRLTTANGAIVRGSHLRAVQVLEQRALGAQPRVRFEWTALRGVREYVLVGQWTGVVSWTVQRREFRVTPRSATRWTAQQVAFETQLPEGSHSWKLLAVLAANDVREVGEPSLLSFAVR